MAVGAGRAEVGLAGAERDAQSRAGGGGRAGRRCPRSAAAVAARACAACGGGGTGARATIGGGAVGSVAGGGAGAALRRRRRAATRRRSQRRRRPASRSPAAVSLPGLRGLADVAACGAALAGPARGRCLWPAGLAPGSASSACRSTVTCASAGAAAQSSAGEQEADLPHARQITGERPREDSERNCHLLHRCRDGCARRPAITASLSAACRCGLAATPRRCRAGPGPPDR